MKLTEKYVPAGQSLNEQTIFIFSSVLAWCHHSSFFSEYKALGFVLGMYFPLGQWSKSLKMRKATLGTCLKELEDAGFIEICSANGGEVTNNAVKRYYCLTVTLPEPLPAFKPSEPTITVTERHKVTGKCQQTDLIHLTPEPLNKRPEPASNSSPSMNHDY